MKVDMSKLLLLQGSEAARSAKIGVIDVEIGIGGVDIGVSL